MFLNRFCRNSSLALRPFDSVGVTCAGISPTCRENARSSSDPGAVAEDKTKSKVQHEASDFVKDEYLIEHYEYQTETSCSDKVKGRLRSHVQFWEEIGAYSNILDIIKNGYKIPFYSLPSTCFQKNNKSALQHGDFVGKAIAELLDDGLIEECSEVPYIVNPLTVLFNQMVKRGLF